MSGSEDRIEELLNRIDWNLVGPGQHALSSARGAAKHIAKQLESSIIKQLCEALEVPYETPDMRSTRYVTLDEVLADVKARTDMWQKLLGRIEVVDPKWLEALRNGDQLWDGPYDPSVKIVVRIHSDNTASIWNRTRMPMDLFVTMLRGIADEFESGKARRIG